MRIHRVTWVDPNWTNLRPHEPFHPLYVPVDRQGAGRFDNPHRYVALYAATSAAAAVGETLGNYAAWTADEVARPKQGRPRCLVTLEFTEEEALVDLDDAATLVRLGLRPSEITRRNRDRTRELALELWLTGDVDRPRGVRWRSYWRPEWEVVSLWSDGPDPPWFPFVVVAAVDEPLAIDTPTVVQAADVLPRVLETRRRG